MSLSVFGRREAPQKTSLSSENWYSLKAVTCFNLGVRVEWALCGVLL